MRHAHGTHLDGIASVEDLRQRSVVDEESGCWHLRTARGKPLPRGDRHVIWVHGIGHITATRAAWLLSRPGKTLRNGWICFRNCDSYDCVAPSHISSGNRGTWFRHIKASGKARTPAKLAAVAALPKSTQKLTPELRQWLIESQQSGVDAAHALGITQSRANCIRAEHRKAQATRPAASVFDFASRLASHPKPSQEAA